MNETLSEFGNMLHQRQSSCIHDPTSTHLDTYWSTEDYLFCGFSLAEYGSLDELTANAYEVILNYASELNYHLQRCWHFIPRIHELERDVERYQLFCSGRHKALIISGAFKPHELPAASAVGSEGGLFNIFALLGKQRGECIENPHQVSAYNYPKQYGVDSPSFSRAYKVDDTLFISGTASIKGHMTQHPSNLRKQLREIQLRVDSLLEELTPKYLTAYVKEAKDVPEVEKFIKLNYDTVDSYKIVSADICREDLMVEIELIAQ